MKKFLLILAGVVLMTGSVFAQKQQDVVYLQNGSIVRGTIIEQVPNESVKIQTSDGSVFFYAITDVEKMTKEGAIKKQKDSRTKTSIKWEVKYRGEINCGYAFGNKFKYSKLKFESNVDRPYVEMIHGVSISDYMFVGVGLGMQCYLGEIYKNSSRKWNMLTFPIFGNIKGMYPVTSNFKPYVNASFGSTIVPITHFSRIENDYDYYEDLEGGFYYALGIGLQYDKFNFGIGLQHQVLKDTIIEEGRYYDDPDIVTMKKISFNAIYVKVGFAF